MSVGQKMSILKICLTIVTCLNHCNPEAATKETVKLRRLIKGSNKTLGPYLYM